MKRWAMWIGALIPATAMALYCGLAIHGETAGEVWEGVGYSLTAILIAGVAGCIAVESAYWLASFLKRK